MEKKRNKKNPNKLGPKGKRKATRSEKPAKTTNSEKPTEKMTHVQVIPVERKLTTEQINRS